MFLKLEITDTRMYLIEILEPIHDKLVLIELPKKKAKAWASLHKYRLVVAFAARIHTSEWTFTGICEFNMQIKISKGAKIRNRYNQVQHRESRGQPFLLSLRRISSFKNISWNIQISAIPPYGRFIVPYIIFVKPSTLIFLYISRVLTTFHSFSFNVKFIKVQKKI